MKPSNQKHGSVFGGLQNQQKKRDFTRNNVGPIPLLRAVACALVLLISGAVLALGAPGAGTAGATAGINQEMSFQGKIVTSSGQNIPDGTYNMEFRIYTGCTNEPTDNTGCTAVWTEDYLKNNSQGVTFTSGTYQVNLGSICAFTTSTCENNSNTAVDWNSYPLYLSLQIGSTSNCSTNNPGSAAFGADCGGDGEMDPYILLTSTPYAFNSNELGGLTASQFIQTTPSSGQTIQPIANVSSLIVDQNSSGSFGQDVFDIQGSSGGSNNFMQVTSTAANQGAVTLQALGTSNALSLQSAGALNIGTSGVANTVQIGNTSGAVAQTVAIGTNSTSGATNTINIGTASSGSTTTISLGSTTSGSTTTLKGGAASVAVTNGGGLAAQGADSTSATNAFSAVNSQNNSLLQVRDDGQINLGQTQAGALGYTANGPNSSGWQSLLSAQAVTTTAATSISSISVQAGTGGVAASPNDQFQVAIYADNGSNAPGAYIASSVPTTLSAGWNTVSVSASLSAATRYWLVYWTNVNVSNADNGESLTNGSYSQYLCLATVTWGSGASNGLPTTFPSCGVFYNTTYVASIYATTGTATAARISSLGVLGVYGAATFANYVNSSTAFQVQNASGSAVLTADTSNGLVALGDGSGLDGALQFRNATNGNDLTLVSGATTTSYSLTMPAAGATGSQCLQSTSGSTSTNTSLQFGSCSSGSYINNATTAQSANLYVQAATSGSVAGVLEANASGSGDILDLKNGSGTTVDSFSSTGDMSISTAETTGTVAAVTGNSVTSGNALSITANNLTTGYAASVNSSSIQQTAGSLFNVSDTAQLITNGTSTTGSLVSVNRNVSTNITSGGSTATPAVDNKATFTQSSHLSPWSSSSITISSGHSNYYVFVALIDENACDPTTNPTVSVGGTSLTLIDASGNPPLDGNNCYFLFGHTISSTGSQTITVTDPDTDDWYNMQVDDWYNVNQSTPTGTDAKAAGGQAGTANPSITAPSITSSAWTSGHVIVEHNIVNDPTCNVAPSTGQTAIYGDSGGTCANTIGAFAAYKTSVGGSQTVSWSGGDTSGGGYWIEIAIDLIGATTTPSGSFTGPVASFTDNCTQTAGTCTDSSNVVQIKQQYSGASGAALYVQNAGTGYALQVQDGSGNTLLVADTAGAAVTVSGTASTFASLTVTNAHFKVTQTNPPAVGTISSCGTSPSVTFTSGDTDDAGSFYLTSGSSSTGTCSVQINFNKAFGAAPKAVVMQVTQSIGSATGTLAPIVTATSASSFTFKLSGTDATSTKYAFYYWIVE